MLVRNFINNAAGDTIVEVLFSIVILSFILTGAYVSANNSLHNIRDAQERIQALGYAQSQAEDLRALSLSAFQGGNSQYLTTNAFCFANVGSSLQLVGFSIGNYPPNCRFGSIPYKVQIEGEGPSPAPDKTNNFKITVTWASISPNATTAQVTIYYRVGT